MSYKSVCGANHHCSGQHSEVVFFSSCFLFFLERVDIGISCETSAMGCQDSFFLRNEGGSLECCLLQVLFSTLRSFDHEIAFIQT